jgi:hypothetical protein
MSRRLAFWKAIRRIPPPVITPEQALSIAQMEYVRRGEKWRRTIKVMEELHAYRIYEGRDSHPTQIVVCNSDGSIIEIRRQIPP